MIGRGVITSLLAAAAEDEKYRVGVDVRRRAVLPIESWVLLRLKESVSVVAAAAEDEKLGVDVRRAVRARRRVGLILWDSNPKLVLARGRAREEELPPSIVRPLLQTVEEKLRMIQKMLASLGQIISPFNGRRIRLSCLTSIIERIRQKETLDD